MITNNITVGKNPSLYKKFVRYAKIKLSYFFKYPLQVYNYKEVYPKLVDEVERKEKIIPVILPNWDYTPRRGASGLILKNATPELFKEQ